MIRYKKVNAVECLSCGVYLLSLSVHDYRACKCGTMVDGGFDYVRRGGDPKQMRELNLYMKMGIDLWLSLIKVFI